MTFAPIKNSFIKYFSANYVVQGIDILIVYKSNCMLLAPPHQRSSKVILRTSPSVGYF